MMKAKCPSGSLKDAAALSPAASSLGARLSELSIAGYPSGAELLEWLHSDKALEGRLLRLFSSCAFRHSAENVSLGDAISEYGPHDVATIAYAVLIHSHLDGAHDRDEKALASEGRKVVTTALAARQLSRIIRRPLGAEAFLCGLLVRRATPPPGDNEGDSARSEIGPRPSEQLEEFQDIWSLPDVFVQVLSCQRDPRNLPEHATVEARDLANIVRLAALSAEVLTADSKGSAMQSLHDGMRTLFGISDPEVDAFLVSMDRGITEVAEALEVPISPSDRLPRIVENARKQMAEARMPSTKSPATSSGTKVRAADQVDRLTGLPSGRAVVETLSWMISSRRNAQGPRSIGIILADVDHLRRVNEGYGHRAGDVILQLVCQAMKHTLRGSDLVGRTWGDEFIGILTDVTREELRSVAERVRLVMCDRAVVPSFGSERLSISLGCLFATIDCNTTAEGLLSEARERLAEAKSCGGDTVR